MNFTMNRAEEEVLRQVRTWSSKRYEGEAPSLDMFQIAENHVEFLLELLDRSDTAHRQTKDAQTLAIGTIEHLRIELGLTMRRAENAEDKVEEWRRNTTTALTAIADVQARHRELLQGAEVQVSRFRQAAHEAAEARELMRQQIADAWLEGRAGFGDENTERKQQLAMYYSQKVGGTAAIGSLVRLKAEVRRLALALESNKESHNETILNYNKTILELQRSNTEKEIRIIELKEERDAARKEVEKAGKNG